VINDATVFYLLINVFNTYGCSTLQLWLDWKGARHGRVDPDVGNATVTGFLYKL